MRFDHSVSSSRHPPKVAGGNGDPIIGRPIQEYLADLGPRWVDGIGYPRSIQRDEHEGPLSLAAELRVLMILYAGSKVTHFP
jgi:hypothetical protein